MRISDWSSDVCSSDLMSLSSSYGMRVHPVTGRVARHNGIDIPAPRGTPIYATADGIVGRAQRLGGYGNYVEVEHGNAIQTRYGHMSSYIVRSGQQVKKRSEEHTSELQSLIRISYAVFCLKKKNTT